MILLKINMCVKDVFFMNVFMPSRLIKMSDHVTHERNTTPTIRLKPVEILTVHQAELQSDRSVLLYKLRHVLPYI